MSTTEKQAPEILLSPIGNKRVKQKKDQFCSFVNEHLSRPFYVCSHDNPDPDSLASAYGMKRILNFLGVEVVEIYYCGEISHPQNRAMQNVLNIPAKKWTPALAEEVNRLEEKPVFVYVDCCQPQKNMSIPFEPSIAIDHHKNTAPKNVVFIHDEIGSSSTLIVDLMLLMPPSGEDTPSYCFDPDAETMKEIITALAIGIKTDTLDFRNETTAEDDFKAYKLLSRYISDDKFQKIVNYELPPYVFDAEQVAWTNRNQNPPNLITGLGFIDEARSDCIPYLADKMMRLQGIQTVMVYAIAGRALRTSVRTASASLDAQNLLDETIGEKNGGAKHGAGGGTVHFHDFDPDEMNDEERALLWSLTKSVMERKFRKVTEK